MAKKLSSEAVYEIPPEISHVIFSLKDAGFEAYLIGGCVRDLILKRKPKDWDVTTNAKPDEIIKIFPKTFYENDYGTVGVVNESATDETLKIVEVTPYRTESDYSDRRRPDSVSFSSDLKDDLKRRDFTINAIALDIEKDKKEGSDYKGQTVDLFGGLDDIKNKVIRAVGSADERFKEDALRVLRAVRISCEIGFSIEENTKKAIQNDGKLLKEIATERIRDEFSRILMSDRPKEGLELAHEVGILGLFLPELEEGIGIKQNKAHAYDVWEHLLRSLEHAAKKKWPLDIRVAALLHDISKPETRRWSEEKKEWTFYGHDVVGSRKTEKILERLKFPKKLIEKVVKLVLCHMFFSDTEQITLSAVRRLVAKVGKENVWDLMNVRICDRIGTGRPKESPYRLRKYQSMIEEAMRDPISVGMLKIDGTTIIEKIKIPPGPKIGHILHILLEEVLDDPLKNTADYLEGKALELSKLSDKQLDAIGKKAKSKKEAEEGKEVEIIRKKYWVK